MREHLRRAAVRMLADYGDLDAHGDLAREVERIDAGELLRVHGWQLPAGTADVSRDYTVDAAGNVTLAD